MAPQHGIVEMLAREINFAKVDVYTRKKVCEILKLHNLRELFNYKLKALHADDPSYNRYDAVWERLCKTPEVVLPPGQSRFTECHAHFLCKVFFSQNPSACLTLMTEHPEIKGAGFTITRYSSGRMKLLFHDAVQEESSRSAARSVTVTIPASSYWILVDALKTV